MVSAAFTVVFPSRHRQTKPRGPLSHPPRREQSRGRDTCRARSLRGTGPGETSCARGVGRDNDLSGQPVTRPRDFLRHEYAGILMPPGVCRKKSRPELSYLRGVSRAGRGRCVEVAKSLLIDGTSRRKKSAEGMHVRKKRPHPPGGLSASSPRKVLCVRDRTQVPSASSPKIRRCVRERTYRKFWRSAF
jgi:hypothetical protein